MQIAMNKKRIVIVIMMIMRIKKDGDAECEDDEIYYLLFMRLEC